MVYKGNVCNIGNMNGLKETIKLQVIVTKQLADEFRAKVGQKLGANKGAISQAFTEALTDWIKKK